MPVQSKLKTLLFIILLAVQGGIPTSVSAQLEPRVVQIGVYQNAPQVFIDKTGAAHGIYVDILNEVARLEGWKLDYVQGSFTEHLDAVKDGRIDMITSIAATPERKEIIDFSRETIVSVWAQLYVSPGLTPHNILDLDGRKIAVMRDGLLGKAFQNLCVNFAITCNILAVASYDDALQAVDDGKVDGAVVNSILGFAREKKYKAVRSSIVFSPVPLQVAVPKGKNSDLVAALDRRLAEWRSNKSSIYYQIIDHWLGLKPEETFTTPTWLKWLLGISGASIALIFFWNTILRKEVSQRKRVETALRLSDERYSQILENMSSGVAIYEAVDDGRDFLFTDFNRASERIENIKKSETIGKRLTEVFPSAKEFGIIDVLHRVWITGKPEHFPIAMYQDKRISGWRENYIYKLPTGEVVAIYDDITERKQAEDALRKSEEEFRTIVQTTSEGFWLIDPASKVTLEVNLALCKMLGYTEDEILGKTPFDFADSKNIDVFKTQTSKISDTVNRAYNITLKNKDGHDVFTHFEASTIYNDDGTPRIAFAFIKDITESVRVQNELRLAKEEADQANQAKSAFLASMSHELRTPLNSIIGFAEMMHYEVKGPLSEAYKEYTGLITRSGRLLLETISSVLDIAKIEAGKFELFREPTFTGAIVNEVLTILSIQAQDKGLTIHNKTHDMHHLLIDPLRIKQVILNVIGNAIKFTDTGEITVANHCDESGHNITVSDTGIGMTEEQIKIALQPFRQVHGTALARRYQGTGLGLSYSQKIMELHGGTLTITGTLGVGTTIILHFPPEVGDSCAA